MVISIPDSALFLFTCYYVYTCKNAYKAFSLTPGFAQTWKVLEYMGLSWKVIEN